MPLVFYFPVLLVVWCMRQMRLAPVAGLTLPASAGNLSGGEWLPAVAAVVCCEVANMDFVNPYVNSYFGPMSQSDRYMSQLEHLGVFGVADR